MHLPQSVASASMECRCLSKIVSICPSNLFDTVYPVNALDHWIREARMDYGGSFNEGALRATLSDIQDHVAVTYGLQEINSYNLPEICRAWIVNHHLCVTESFSKS